MGFFDVINDAVQAIEGNEKKKLLLVQQLGFLRKKKFAPLSPSVLEENFVFPVQQKKLDCSIAGVDSGFVGKSLHSVDIVFIRAVGVVFHYKGGVFAKADYFPNFFSFPAPFLTNLALDADELNCSKSLLRLREEISTAKKIIEKFSPNYCFLDGSIVPQYADKPRSDSKAFSEYKGIIKEFQSLFETAQKNNCTLVACVEDSRGSRFKSIIQEELLPAFGVQASAQFDNYLDSSLLDSILLKGERCFAFPYTKKIAEHPILNEFEERWSKSVFAFYLKPSEFDRPLRVEFLCERAPALTKTADEIASVVFALSSLHREYAFPSILIEADLRAGLKPEEIDLVFNKIRDKLSKKLSMQLRRNSRPF